MKTWRRASDASLLVLAIAACVIVLMPPLAGLVMSLLPRGDIGSITATAWTVENYSDLFGQSSFWLSLGNSLASSLLATLFAILLGAFAAFALTRFRSVYDKAAWLILAIRMVPGVVLVIPFYLLFRTIGVLDSIPAVVTAYLTFSLPLAVWMIRSFFQSIPIELDEAAALDGASDWQILWLVLMPVAAPGILVTAVLVFIFCWNEFLFSLVLTDQKAVTFLPLLTRFILPDGPLYGQIFAGATLFLVPPLIALFLIRHRLSDAFGVGLMS
jgi:multiple sugar transport system permease protein